MSVLSFLNSGFLAALGLAGIPILVHLIRRRRIRIVRWAAWDFLQQARKRNRRRLRLEQLLLLLVRMAVVALVALAICRPVVRTQGLSLLKADTRIHALIAIDGSYSMGHLRGGTSDFDRAKKVADDLMARVLKRGDSISVALVSTRPQAVIKDPSFELARARERVRALKLTDLGTDYAAGAALALELLKPVRTPVKEVYWITDNHRNGFPESGSERLKTLFAELGRVSRLTWVNVAAPARENISVHAPALSRELVTPGAPVRIEAVVRNHTAQARTGVLVNLLVDGSPAGSDRVDIPAGGAARARFTYLFARSGPHFGVVRLGIPDPLPADNQAYFAVRVRDGLKVLVANGRPHSDPARDEAFYVATALAPGSSSGQRGPVKAIVQESLKLGAAGLRSYDAVILTGVESVAPADRTALLEYIKAGGGALVFPSPTADAATLNAALTPGGSGAEPLLPARFRARKSQSGDQAVRLNPATISHPALAAFRSTDEIDLGSGRMSTFFELELPPGDDAVRVMCRFTGGQPALVERRLGQGRILLAAMPAGANAGDLPFKPAFVPLIHQLTAYLSAGASSQRSLSPGEHIVTRFDVREAGKPVRVRAPDGTVRSEKSALGPQGVIFTSHETWKSGIYRVGTASSPYQDTFAVNVPETESDLTSLPVDQIRSALSPTRVQFAEGGAGLPESIRHSRQGTEIWRTLVLAALPLLFLEALLAQRFGRRG